MGETHNLIVEVNGDAIPDIPKPLSIMLIQCVRELLFNIVKHAGVKVASVTVNQPEEKTIRVIVSDGGNGFPANMTTDPLPSKGLGMFQLRERLACIGGSLDVASMPEQGARVTITVPIS
jgi:signal transduction histidine kinase